MSEILTSPKLDLDTTMPMTGRMQAEDGKVYNRLDLSGVGTTYINGKPQGSVFGADVVIAQEKAELSGKWDLGINLKDSSININGSGYVKIMDNESILQVCSGTDPDGSVILTSKQRIRYEPGTPIYSKFTTNFPELSESNGDYTLGIGLGEGFSAGDSGIGLYQRRRNDALEYGVVLVRDGVATYYPTNGVLPTNPEIINIFRVEWGYLGVAPFNLYWRDIDNEKWTRVHRQLFKQKVTSVTKPDLPVGIFIQNEGNTADICITNGSYEAGTINGGKAFDSAARISTYRRDLSGNTGTNQLIFAFQNPKQVDMYNYVDVTLTPTTRSFRNSIASQLLEVGLGVLDNNKLVNIDLVIVDSTQLTDGTWTSVDLGYSVLSVSTDVTPVLTDGKVMEIFSRGKDENDVKLIETLDLLLPGQTALFVYTTTSAAFDLSAYIKYQDLF